MLWQYSNHPSTVPGSASLTPRLHPSSKYHKSVMQSQYYFKSNFDEKETPNCGYRCLRQCSASMWNASTYFLLQLLYGIATASLQSAPFIAPLLQSSFFYLLSVPEYKPWEATQLWKACNIDINLIVYRT